MTKANSRSWPPPKHAPTIARRPLSADTIFVPHFVPFVRFVAEESEKGPLRVRGLRFRDSKVMVPVATDENRGA